MKIDLVTYDSFSTRSMATFIETKDIKIFIDPSISISPNRFGLKPHLLELNSLKTGEERIINKIKESDVIIITHYHWDHCPRPNSEITKNIKNKKVILKDIKKKVNISQKKRGLKVYEILNKNNELIFGDSKKFEFNNTLIKISNPVWHGPEKTKLGYVNMVLIYESEKLLFGSDIQGILNEKTREEIIKLDPDIFILSGPPTYLESFDKKHISVFEKNLLKIFEKTNVKTIIIDHHLLRDLDWKKKIENIFKISREFNVKILTAAEYMGKPILQLEARRKELYERY